VRIKTRNFSAHTWTWKLRVQGTQFAHVMTQGPIYPLNTDPSEILRDKFLGLMNLRM